MNVFCVNKSHKDFKKLSKELDIHEDQLNDIIFKYENDNQVDAFPSKEYIENVLRGDNPITSLDQYGIWLNKYSEPKVFDSKEEANSYIEEAKRLFPGKEAIVAKRKVNGQIEVTVGRPYDKNDITSLLMHHLNTYEGIEVGNSTELGNYLQENGYTSILEAIEAEKEMLEIKAKAISDGTFMKAPNGKPTNLNERQWLQVRTKNFINWFGDWINDPVNASKVVDENGEPLVVYHGSKVTDIRIFKKDDHNSGYYFTSDINYAKNKFGNEIYQIFLNIKNPLDLRLTYNKDEGGAAYYKGRKLNLHELAEMELNHKNVDSGAPYYIREGYDGIFGNDSVDTAVNGEEQIASEGTEYVVWNPNQIKSATDNNGEFSLFNDDILAFIGNPLYRELYQADKVYQETVNELNRINKLLYGQKIYESSMQTSSGEIKISQSTTDKEEDKIQISSGRSVFNSVSMSIIANTNKNLIGGSIILPSKQLLEEDKNYNRLNNPIRNNHVGILKAVLEYFIETGHKRPTSKFQWFVTNYGYKRNIETLSEILGVDVSSYFQYELSLPIDTVDQNGKHVKRFKERITVDVEGLLKVLPSLQDTKQYDEVKKAIKFNEQDNTNYKLQRKVLTDLYKALQEKSARQWDEIQKIKKEIQKQLDETSGLPFFKTPQGEIYGFIGKDNKIYLDEHIISPEHPIHEYTHLWDRVVAKRNPKLWKRGVELMKKTSLWELYANDPNYGLKWKATEEMTAERFEELVASEVHARLVGKEGEELLTQLAKEKGSKNIIEKLKSWLLDVWRELKSTFSNWSQEDINKLTLEDFNNMTLRDFVNKVSLDTNSLLRSLDEEYYAEREDIQGIKPSSVIPLILEQQQQPLPGPEIKINIYAGTGENADLSNFATRPFTFQRRTFTSVELAFLIAKLEALKAQLVFFGSEPAKTAASKIDKVLEEIKNSKTGAEVKKLGGTRITSRSQDVKDIIDMFFAKGGAWDKLSLKAMKMLIKASFEQNPQALQRLLATGNATLTHTQDKGKWGTEFPRFLMEVREELRGQYQQNIQQEKQKIATLEKDLGGGERADAEITDAVKVAKKGLSFEEALKGQESFFSKEEQDQIKQGLNGRNLQVMSVSRLTDPAFFSKEIISFLEKNAEKPLNDPTRITTIEIWSKHDGLPIKDILDACKKYRVAPMVSFSITGLGGTALEEGVMKYQDMLEKVGKLIKNGTLNPTTTTIRIDPILPGITNMDDIRKIVETAKSYGIKKFVTSLVQSYGSTENRVSVYNPTSKYRYDYYTISNPKDVEKLKVRFPELDITGVNKEKDGSLVLIDSHGNKIESTKFNYDDRKVVLGINNALASEGKTYDWDKYYGRQPWDGKIAFKPKQEVIDEIGKTLLELDKDPEITIQTCSFGIKGLKVSACLDPMIIERITGVDVLRKDGTYDRDTSRPECMCYGCHGDFFKGQNKKCFSSCAYCYAAHSGDNKLNYYNEDGTLKDNDYTRTERLVQSPIQLNTVTNQIQTNKTLQELGVQAIETLKTLNITPAKSVDKKAAAKGSISNKFIGFAEGITGSSTAEYARQAGDKANIGTYSSVDTVFVSIPGMRGNADVRHAQQDRTIQEALKALNAGATLITDNEAYTKNSSYNEGEKKLAKALKQAGAQYSERVVNGLTLGVWKLSSNTSTQNPVSSSTIVTQQSSVPATETLKTAEEQVKPKQEQTETTSNQTLSKEALKHINRCQVYKKQVEELSKSFKKSEIQTLSTSIANRVSSIISEIEENPNLIKDYFNLERSELSETPTREEIINKIGINNLYKAIANKYFGNVKSFSKRGKAIKIQRNFQILMLLSNPILSKNEGIQVDFNFTKKDVEYILASFDENDEANENSATSQESWQNNIRTVSVENMMLPKIRRLLSNLPLIKNGELIKDEWGIPQTVSLREAIGTILNAIGGKAKDHKQMASLLTLYIEDSKNTWLQPIVDILNDTTGKYETELSLLYKDFYKNSLKFSVSGKDFISHVIDSKLDYAFSRIKQTFGSKLWVLLNKTDNKVNKEELNKLLELATVNKLKTKEGIKQLYEAFGIYLSNLDAERIVSLGREESLVTTIRSIYAVLKEVNEEFTPFDRNSDSGISSYLHTLLEPYVKITSEGFTSTVVSEGKRYQLFVLPSFLSKFNSIIQNSSEEELVNWMMNTYGNVEWYKLSDTNTEDALESVADGWRNPILQLLATDPNFRKNFDWTQSLGYREEKLYLFMRTMSPLQCFKMQLNMFNATDGRKGDIIPAWYAVPLMANKPSAEFIKLNRYRGDNYKATILGLLAPMFIKEVYRIKLVKDRKNFIKEHPEKEIQNFDKRGDKFCNFEMFNDVSESSKKIIEDFIEGKASVEELSNMFNSEMTKYLDSRVTTNSMLLSIQSTALENFYWNNFLAKMSMEDLFLGDSAFYKNVVDKVKRALLLHSSGQRPNTSATWNKKSVSDGKHRAIVLSSFDKIKSNIISNLKEVFAKKATLFTGEERNAFEAYVDSIIKLYEEVDVTDGQAYTTISGYRKKAIMFGKWSKEAEEVYNRLKNGEFNLSDLKLIFQPLKPFQYSQTNTDLSNNGQIVSNVSSTLVPSLYKTAEYLLIMADALLLGKEKNNILKAITDIIEDTHSGDALDGIDTVLFDSSVKEGNNAVIDISILIKEGKTAGDIKTEINNKISGYKQDANNPYVKVTPFEDYMILQELPPHFKDHYQSFPTLARYLAITDLLSNFNGEEVLFTIGDKSYTVKELQQEWEKVWKEEVDYGTDKLLKELAINSGNKAERNVRLSKLLVNSLLDSSKMNMETFESILVDENGEFQMPIDDPALATTVMPLIFSAVKSRVNKQTAAGGPIVQVSSFGTSKKLNIRFKDKSGKLLPTREGWENSKNKSHKSYNDFIKENQAGVAYMEVYASVPSDEIFNTFRDKKGNIDINAINRVNPGLLEMIGVRIPTEGKLSMWPMKIVGFLPSEAGEAIMLPEEITKITGSDFDSDKQYIIRKALSVVERTAENKKEKVINYLLEQNKNYTREFVEKAYDEYMENPENYKDSEDVHWEVENALSKSHIRYAARATEEHNKRRNHIFDMMMAVLLHESVADQLLTPQGFDLLKVLAAEINGVSDFSELQNDPTNLTDLATYLNYYNLNKEGGQMLGIFASQKIAHAVLSMDNYHLLISGLEKTPFKLGGQVYKGLIAIDPLYNKEGTLIGEILGSCVGASADVTKDPVLPYLGINSYNINVFITGVRLGIPLKPLVLLLNHPALKALYAEKSNGETKSLKSLVSKELKEQLEKAGFEKEGRNSEMFMSKDALETDLTALNAFLTLIYCSETVDALSKKTRLNSTTDSATVGPYFGDFLYKDKVLSNQVPEVYDEEGNFVDANDTFYKNHPMLDALYNAFPIIKKIFKDTSLGNLLNTILEEGLRTTGVEILKNQGLATKFIKFYLSLLLFYLNQSDPNKGISIKKVADGYYDTFAKNFNKIKESYKDNQLIKTIEIETNNNTGETTLLIPNLDDLGREEVNALRAAWEDLAIDAPEVARDLFEWNAVKGGLTFNPNTFVHLAGNNVRSLIPGYKEAFAGNADFNISKIYDDFIVKYWRQLMLPRLTPKIKAEKSYKYVTYKGFLYKLNDSGEYGVVNTNIPVYQQLSELMDENKSESQEGIEYLNDLYASEEVEISDNAIAVDALDSSIREESSNYLKYNKDVENHIEMTEEEKEDLNDELDKYC